MPCLLAIIVELLPITLASAYVQAKFCSREQSLRVSPLEWRSERAHTSHGIEIVRKIERLLLVRRFVRGILQDFAERLRGEVLKRIIVT